MLQGNKFETVTVKVGVLSDAGDFRKAKRFKGKHLGGVRTYEGARSRDDRGVDYDVYLRPDGTYLVHIIRWSRWQGETDIYELVSVSTAKDLYNQFPAAANAANVEYVEDLDAE